MLTPKLCRAGRALLGWTIEHLAERSGLTHRAVSDYEREATKPRESTRQALQSALEAGGILFITVNDSTGVISGAATRE